MQPLHALAVSVDEMQLIICAACILAQALRDKDRELAAAKSLHDQLMSAREAQHIATLEAARANLRATHEHELRLAVAEAEAKARQASSERRIRSCASKNASCTRSLRLVIQQMECPAPTSGTCSNVWTRMRVEVTRSCETSTNAILG